MLFLPYCRQRLADDPHLWASTLFDEVTALGYQGAYSTFTRALRRYQVRPPCAKPFSRASSRQPTLERDPLEPTATGNCPHCQQPVTVVALLATPEAARPSVPTAIPDIVPLRRTP
ncbi:hypothetical protein GCM10010390_87850 [Streptomyces mordarskii]|uniref:Transposase n=1 Tax=Streptomyces mordarskii TaxID=1226758 RepID=A0ABN1EPF1_9ACTN